jgi:hypothetical protein
MAQWNRLMPTVKKEIIAPVATVVILSTLGYVGWVVMAEADSPSNVEEALSLTTHFKVAGLAGHKAIESNDGKAVSSLRQALQFKQEGELPKNFQDPAVITIYRGNRPLGRIAVFSEGKSEWTPANNGPDVFIALKDANGFQTWLADQTKGP